MRRRSLARGTAVSELAIASCLHRQSNISWFAVNCGVAMSMNEKALYYVEMLLKAAEVVNRRSSGMRFSYFVYRLHCNCCYISA